MAIKTESAFEQTGFMDRVPYPVKIIGGSIISGLAGLATAKAVEHLMVPDIDPKVLYEASVVTCAALLGGFVTSEVAA